MSHRKHAVVTILLVVSVSLISSMLTALLLIKHYSGIQFQTVGAFCQMITEESALHEDVLMELLKKKKETGAVIPEKYENVQNHGTSIQKRNLLEKFGYEAADFMDSRWKRGYLAAGASFIIGTGLFLAVFIYRNRGERRKIRELTEYLEKVNTGEAEILAAVEEDECSRLQDEIYKTVTALYQTRQAALAAKNNFVENLYNIAHQLKTPITAISLSAQTLEEHCSVQVSEKRRDRREWYAEQIPEEKYDQQEQYAVRIPENNDKMQLQCAAQIRRQIALLTHLEESLLLLARIDAGTLALNKTDTDAFTVLTLAADNLEELQQEYGVLVEIPDLGEVQMKVDAEWTMEAVMNLMKNCMEHSQTGAKVHCIYEQNPLYVRIQIWDEGAGFEKEDIPHLFERFYRGENAAKGGIGIGLALSKAIIEMQNGMLSAGNRTEGGAYFEIRLYCH